MTSAVRHLSEETRRKISIAHKGKPKPWLIGNTHSLGKRLSEETRQRMSAARKGKPGHPHTEETKNKLRLANLGHSPSMETRAKLSSARLGKRMSEETKRRLSAAKMGKPCAEETKRKIRITKTGVSLGPCSEKTKQKISEALKGRHLSDEHKEKDRKAHLGKQHTDAAKRNMSQAQKDRKHSAETIKNMRLASYKRWQDPQYRIKMREVRLGNRHPMFGKHHSDQTRCKMSESHRRNWQDIEYAGKVLKRMTKARKRKPNNPELLLRQLLDAHFPGEWKYVGNGQVTLGRLCPDFININGQKKIIEMFGTYWHRDRKGLAHHQTELGRREIFARYGFQMLVIWEDQLGDRDSLVQRIARFQQTDSGPEIKEEGEKMI